MHVSRLILHEYLELLGWPGVAGMLCIFGVLSYLAFGMIPAWQQVQTLEVQLAQHTDRQPGAASPVATPDRMDKPLDVFHRTLPAQLEATTAIDHIYALAGQQNIVLESGEYALGIDPRTQLARYQIILPLRGSYPQLRLFLHALLNDMPGLVLEDIDVQRKQISDSELQGRLRLTLYLSRPS